MSTETPAGRRTVLRGAALAGTVGITGAGLAACGGKKDTADGPTKPVDLGSASAVPVGSAKLYREDRVLVSQPQQGRFKAFSAVCTHQGCVLDSVQGTTASCPCHGSQFDVETGKVVQGPAVAPLPAVDVTERGGKLTAGPGA
ncbi:Rieske (2Fe-2S) protein [Actinacidiphila yeochonensis]|uniref:Rieske (2Fe-2S) protein n=1 Tax=Actinacidiphila yeochonensis TaxID=89050 RepID=UPI000568E285|nr:Rieske (2Fe-2S) protein [Actinacidiphila yeochonensis]